MLFVFLIQAEKKGCSATEYGLVFGVFELIVFLVSPVYGQYLNSIGPKVLFNGGIFTTGSSAIVFGLLDKIQVSDNIQISSQLLTYSINRCLLIVLRFYKQDHTLFITLAFIIRIIEALGNAAFLTASFAIIAKEFPDNVSVTFASLETFFGLGLIVGPMVGGFLYQLGGYFLPFATLGLLLFSTAIITACILPKHSQTVQQGNSSGKLAINSPIISQKVIFIAFFSFDTDITKNSGNSCMLDEHNGYKCIDWISWCNTGTTCSAV